MIRVVTLASSDGLIVAMSNLIKLIVGQKSDKVNSEPTKITYEKSELLTCIECSDKTNH